MQLKPYDLGCPARTAYLVAGAAGVATIAALQHHIDPYLQDAAPFGLDIRYTFLTHCHTDCLAGHLELCEARVLPLFAYLPGVSRSGKRWAYTMASRDHDPMDAAGERPWLAGETCHGQGNFFPFTKGVS